MRVGFIGLGNMSGTVIRSLVRDGSLSECEVSVYNRTEEKLNDLNRNFPSISTYTDVRSTVEGCDIVLVGVRSHAAREVITAATLAMKADTHLVSMNGGVTISNLDRLYAGPITKMVPAVTLEAGRGVTLVCHNKRVTSAQKTIIATLFGKSSMVMEIPEEQFEVAGDLTSCAPALIADIMEHFADAGVRVSSIPREKAMLMVLETMLGTAQLLTDAKLSVTEIKERVATKGGITEQGLKVLDRELPNVFDEVITVTKARHEEVKRSLASEFERL